MNLFRFQFNFFSSLTVRVQVTLPFFVLHGEADTVTDPEVSRALYERAGSADKTIKLYPGMWHGLTSGEPDDNIEVVFKDIVAWLDKRSGDDCDVLPLEPPPLQSIHAVQKLNVPASPVTVNRIKPQRPRSNGKYLICGWKGRRMHHHSAM